MKPSKDLVEKVKKASSFSESDLKKWGKLIMSIPCVVYGWTRISCLKDVGMEVDNDIKSMFRIHFCLEPMNEDSDEICIYFKDDFTAGVSDLTVGELDPAKFDSFLGYSGSWTDVVLKMVEVNNQLHDVKKLTLKRID